MTADVINHPANRDARRLADGRLVSALSEFEQQVEWRKAHLRSGLTWEEFYRQVRDGERRGPY